MRLQFVPVMLAVICLVFYSSCKRQTDAQETTPLNLVQETQTDEKIPDSVDELIEWVNKGSADQRLQAMIELSDKTDQLDKILKPIIAQLSHPDTFVKYAANRTIEHLAPMADKQIDRWIKSENTEDITAAAELLRKLGPTGGKYLDRLKTFLKSDSFVKRMSAMFIIEEVGPGAAALIPEIIPMFSSETPNERFAAARCLGAIGSNDEKVVKALIERFEKGLPTERNRATISLVKMGDLGDYDLLSVLLKRTKRFNVVEKEFAIRGLGMLGKDTPEVREAIKKEFESHSNSVYAAVAWWRLTGDAETSLAQLKKDLGSIDKDVAAIDACGTMGTDAAPLIDELIKIGSKKTEGGDEAGYRLYVMEALVKIGPTDERVHTFLKECANQEFVLVSWMAKKHLSDLEKSE